MTHRLIIQADAESEFIESYRWYEEQSTGLGEEFLRCVDACLLSIQRNPKQYAIVHKKVRRALTRRFPFGVFYLVERDAVVVLAIFHLSRDPKQWRGRS
ncbi:MAG: type II toxin-antitoxin system RelE/ParE family toxin [Planctomycetota bacterium]|nr:type II toxin-antitoxin system RelE/ParE family toxin [Planctomycetota bacterium]